jgi:hypothetical protein
MKFWRNAAALLTVFHPETTHTGNHSTPKDVKNEGRPGKVYENKGARDKMPEIISGICARLEPFLQKIRVSSSPNSSKVPRSSTRACPTARACCTCRLIRRTSTPLSRCGARSNKTLRSHAPRTEEALLQAAKTAFSAISTADCQGFFFSAKYAT